MITVLITGCSIHQYDLIEQLRSNFENRQIRIIGTNYLETELLNKSVDKGYVIRRVEEAGYLSDILSICENEKVDIVFPHVTSELLLMAKNKDLFKSHGIKLSSPDFASISQVCSKDNLYDRYSHFMPRSQHVNNIAEAKAFAAMIGYPDKKICCKIPNGAGGRGFAIVDEAKGRDLSIVHTYGKNQYITIDTMYEYVTSTKGGVILQEYAEGSDYAVCALAGNGETLHILGYDVEVMSYGAPVSASIKDNEAAYEISKQIIKETGYDGILGFDFIIKENGEVSLLECNPRITATIGFVAKAGLNIPYLQCKRLLGEDISAIIPNINRNLKMRKHYEIEYYV